MHRISSWAKAHASSTSSQSQPQAPSTLHNTAKVAEATSSQDGQVNKTAGNAASPELPSDSEKPQKPGFLPRSKDGIIRFFRHTKTALCHSYVNVLLVFVPVGIVAEAVGLNASVIFALNAVAIIPLAGLLSHATECVASRLGDTVGALLNVTFGNAVELIIFIALVKDEIRIVQASLLGSILANLLLILGMSFFLGGLRFQEQIYNNTVTQMSACLLSLSVTSLLLPTAFHASWSDSAAADRYTLKVSRGTSVVLLLVYIMYIVFQLKSHSYLYASTPQQIIDEESHPGVLADFMNSSDSSSSSSDESDDTTTSWTTAKRIKRAMKYRRHRKSSASSRGTASPELFRKSSLADMSSQNRKLSSTSDSTPSHRDETGSYVVDFGDGSREHAARNTSRLNEPQSRDFGQFATSIKFSEDQRESKRDRKTRKKARKHNNHQESTHHPQSDLTLHVDEPLDNLCEPSHIAGETSDPPRKWSPFRPNLPARLLSNTVFATPTDTTRADPMGNLNGIRRTHSLPSMLNRPPPAGNAVQFARAAARGPAPGSPSSPQDSPEHPEEEMSRTAAVVMLLLSTGLVAVCAEFLVDAIPSMLENSSVNQVFIGLVVLSIVGNAAEHVTAVTVATKNKMDLAIGVSVGSSIQIALFVTPLVVILGWCMDKDMSLYFTLFETVCLFVTAFVVNVLLLDGRSNYLEGLLLIAAYVIIAVAAFFYPGNDSASDLGAA